jgi:hypothetical protein
MAPTNPRHRVGTNSDPFSGLRHPSKAALGHLSIGLLDRHRSLWLGYKDLAWATAGGQTTTFLPCRHWTRTTSHPQPRPAPNFKTAAAVSLAGRVRFPSASATL